MRVSRLALPIPPSTAAKLQALCILQQLGEEAIMSQGNGRKPEGESFSGRSSGAREKLRTEEWRAWSLSGGLVLYPSILSNIVHTTELPTVHKHFRCIISLDPNNDPVMQTFYN